MRSLPTAQHIPQGAFSAEYGRRLHIGFGNRRFAEYIVSAKTESACQPDINESLTHFSVSRRGMILYSACRSNAGEQFVNQIIEERKAGKFRSFEDFIERMAPYSVNSAYWKLL